MRGPEKMMIGTTPVQRSGDPMEYHGEIWDTYVPDDESDGRIWERGQKSGKIIQTV